MNKHRQIRIAALSAAATAIAVIAANLTAPGASADVAGPYFRNNQDGDGGRAYGGSGL